LLVNLQDVAAFARREWADQSQRLDYWADRYRREGSAPARTAATALYFHALSLNSSIFDQAHRADDLAGHLRLCEQLGRAARAITGR
jgi:hypothetical protein